MNSYSGKYLVVDLTNQKTEVRELPERLLRDYLGGTGLGIRLVVEWSKPGADALSPDNPIVFACGGLSGTMAPASAVHAVVTKSPLTGLVNCSISSGRWSLALKRAGYDAVVVTGAAQSPVYLFVDDNIVHFRKADRLAGKGCLETEAAIRHETGDSRVQVASIGSAGEKLVRFAAIKDSFRLSHRGGPGAVMGSKKLKAMAVRGTGPVSVHDLGAMQDLCAALNTDLKRRANDLTPASCLNTTSRRCSLPARNYQQSIVDGAGSLAADCADKQHLVKTIACPACPVACQHVYRTTDDPHSDEEAVLEQEALAALGPLCGMYSLPVILRALGLCQAYGLDPVSTGASLAWGMESFEQELLSRKDTDGLDLTFGNPDAILETIHRIGQRSGIGNLLAEGVSRAAARVDHGADHWAMHVKGLEMSGCDPRNTDGLALDLAVGLSTAMLDGHQDPTMSFRDREDLAAAGESIAVCPRVLDHFQDFPQEAARLYALATGMPMSAAELRQAGERINNLKKAYNIREGWKRADDRLPPRLFKDPITSGKADGVVLSEEELRAAIDVYYSARGWTPEGIISKEKLEALGMSDIMEMLKGNWHGAPPHTVRQR